MKTIGITTTVPVEILIAAGYKVIDLNNVFITSNSYARYIDIAERDGFPKSLCTWIKGIYGACIENGIKEIVGVIEGDCSNTKSLIEVLKMNGISVYPFSYPSNHSIENIKLSLNSLMDYFKVEIDKVEYVRSQLEIIRALIREIDIHTYIDCKASGFGNHLYQVSASDFNGDAEEFKEMINKKLDEIRERNPSTRKLRLGYIGVPPMTCDIYEYVEEFNAGFVYNEVQREFAFPRAHQAKDIYMQYYDYTYPYDMDFRLREIDKQIKERSIDGVIHYTQAFCHRGIEDIVIKKNLKVPVLNIEGDRLNCLDSRTKLRIEAFIDMLNDFKEAKN